MIYKGWQTMKCVLVIEFFYGHWKVFEMDAFIKA